MGLQSPSAVLGNRRLWSVFPYQGGRVDVGEVPAFLWQAVQKCLAGVSNEDRRLAVVGLTQAPTMLPGYGDRVFPLFDKLRAVAA